MALSLVDEDVFYLGALALVLGTAIRGGVGPYRSFENIIRISGLDCIA